MDITEFLDESLDLNFKEVENNKNLNCLSFRMFDAARAKNHNQPIHLKKQVMKSLIFPKGIFAVDQRGHTIFYNKNCKNFWNKKSKI